MFVLFVLLFFGIFDDLVSDGLYYDDSIVLFPSETELKVHFALYVHEDSAAGEADRHHDQFGPEAPLELVRVHLIGRLLDQNVEGPDNACDRDQMKHHRAQNFSSLDVVHV